MVLSRLTKITGPGIRTDTNWVGNNANYTGILTASSLGGIGNITATGIITASSFSGDGSGLIGVASTDNIITGTAATFNTYPVDINAGMTVAGVATFAGNVSIAGTLTYEDVTNIDSVGLVTARTGFVSPYADIDDFVDVGSNIQLGNAGVITATTFKGNGDFVELDVDGHTNLDNVSIAGVTTIANDTEFKIGSNANNKLPFKIKQDTGGGNINYIDSRFTYFRSNAIRMYDQDNTSHQVAYFWNNQIGLYASNVETLRVTGSGVNILNGDLTVGRDIDVDGHTNLDNVSIAGITTFSGQGIRIENATNPFIHLKDTTNNTDSYVSTDDGGSLYLKADDNQEGSSSKIVFQVDGSEKIHIESGSGLKFTGKGTSIPVGGILHHTNNNLYVRGGTNGLILGNQDNTNTIQIYNGYIKFETNDGSEKLRIGSAGQIGIAGANYGSSGQVLTSGGASGAVSWTTITGTTINNNANNRIITGSGTANTLEGESTLTYDNPTLEINTDSSPYGVLNLNGNSGGLVQFEDNEVTKWSLFGDSTFSIYDNTGSANRLRITSSGSVMINKTSSFGSVPLQVKGASSGLSDGGQIFDIGTAEGSSGTRLAFGVNEDNFVWIRGYESGVGGRDIVFGASAEKLRITSLGNIKQNLTSPSGTSPYQDSHWYDQGGGHYTLTTTDHDSMTAVRTSSGGDYNNLVYKRVKMSKNCDIEFDLKGNSPASTYRHVGFVINGNGTNATYDRLVFRSRPGNTNSNQIRIDRIDGSGNFINYGFNYESSNIPTFFDGTERHILIQVREKLFNVLVDGVVIVSQKTNNDLQNSSGWFGFGIYEGGENAQVTIRNLSIRNKFQRPHWLVRATGVNASVGNQNAFPFNQIILASTDMSNSSHYNTSNYRYNVPISGLYYCFLRVYRNGGSGSEVAFYVNGSVRNRFRPQPSSGDYIFAGSCLIQLFKGEYIDVRAFNGGFDNFYGAGSSQYSTWGGHLLD